MTENTIIKEKIIDKSRQWGVESVGFAAVESWQEEPENPGEIHPKNIWPATKTVIVLAIPYLPVTHLPDVWGLGGWNAANELLDAAAYQLAVFLNRQGYPSVNIPLDSSGVNIPEHKTIAVFSHYWAGYYANICRKRHEGIAGEHPPMNLVSVLTAWEEA